MRAAEGTGPPDKRKRPPGRGDRFLEISKTNGPKIIAPNAANAKGLSIRINEISDGFEVALHGAAIGRVCRIASYPTRREAVDRAVLEERERGVPLIVESAVTSTSGRA
ncbi:hypothetical protein [Sphingosinicella sp.]|uniref:hypothetical protein n=1 Tax=Sphingosinicella sp. TaxID=1917971 RepID=UPI00181E2A72|nr:hypothetical protein [Sphingosinicella sp.]MBA4758856.1 hypothetical protein [Sphingosinicella sp.]